jgi:hypothetical protein
MMSKTQLLKRIYLLESLVSIVSGLLVAISTCVNLWHGHSFSSSLPTTKQPAPLTYQCKSTSKVSLRQTSKLVAVAPTPITKRINVSVYQNSLAPKKLSVNPTLPTEMR